ncbi:class I SAM-dependent methyltransferase [Actinoplanes sp. CA-030573]|uniref:class I SAM-dependent methyltransferase n=1 Tax=Actinoplanes sp. CA-030573 TaxID=3239898 RepID=UPI003D914E94
MRSGQQYGEPVESTATALGERATGWEFAWLDGRPGEPSWSYPELARALVRRAGAVLDLDTGSGELLAELAPLPPHTVAVESWARNTPVARDRLAPFGVAVLTELPGGEDEFDVVLSRHGRLPAADIYRLLRPGGRLLTQQVGSDDLAEINRILGAPPAYRQPWNAEVAAARLAAGGLEVTDIREEHPELVFTDVGSVVRRLRDLPWQIRDFTPERYAKGLERLDSIIRLRGPLTVAAHRFLLQAARG